MRLEDSCISYDLNDFYVQPSLTFETELRMRLSQDLLGRTSKPMPYSKHEYWIVTKLPEGILNSKACDKKDMCIHKWKCNNIAKLRSSPTCANETFVIYCLTLKHQGTLSGNRTQQFYGYHRIILFSTSNPKPDIIGRLMYVPCKMYINRPRDSRRPTAASHSHQGYHSLSGGSHNFLSPSIIIWLTWNFWILAFMEVDSNIDAKF